MIAAVGRWQLSWNMIPVRVDSRVRTAKDEFITSYTWVFETATLRPKFVLLGENPRAMAKKATRTTSWNADMVGDRIPKMLLEKTLDYCICAIGCLYLPLSIVNHAANCNRNACMISSPPVQWGQDSFQNQNVCLLPTATYQNNQNKRRLLHHGYWVKTVLDLRTKYDSHVCWKYKKVKNSAKSQIPPRSEIRLNVSSSSAECAVPCAVHILPCIRDHISAVSSPHDYHKVTKFHFDIVFDIDRK